MPFHWVFCGTKKRERGVDRTSDDSLKYGDHVFEGRGQARDRPLVDPPSINLQSLNEAIASQPCEYGPSLPQYKRGHAFDWSLAYPITNNCSRSSACSRQSVVKGLSYGRGFFTPNMNSRRTSFGLKNLTIDSQTADLCEVCDELPATVKCSCETRFCETHFSKHQAKHPTHSRGGGRAERVWAWISGAKLSRDGSNSRENFEREQVSKWFGLHVEKSENYRVTRLIETTRFSRLIEESVNQGTARRQFPSIVSFIGETGAGKSTLKYIDVRAILIRIASVRGMISQSREQAQLDSWDAPMPGAQQGQAALLPTTGEVNLYPDPDTFGSETPRFYADCEGMLGGEPAAAQHQLSWPKAAKSKYLLHSRDGKQIDRKTAVMTIYPRFLYIFSDVICMITKNQKAWADSVVHLLDWSRVGSHNTVNQYALPALIVILNGPTIENNAWLIDDDAATNDFFMTIEHEIQENNVLRAMALKHGDKSMKELLLRNFSTVHVHYVPLDGYKKLGHPNNICAQTVKLSKRIRSDAEYVQRQRKDTWTLFDANQMRSVFDYAFKHLASGSDEPFDLNQCRQQVSPPITIEGHFAEFLGRSLHRSPLANFDAVAAVVGSSLFRNALKQDESDLLHPSFIFTKHLRDVCKRAVDQFLSHTQPCSYVNSETGKKCVNTKTGHASGHQSANGTVLEEGNFVEGDIDIDRFLQSVDATITRLLKAMNEHQDPSNKVRRLYATEQHRKYLQQIPDQAFWTDPTPQWMRLFNRIYGATSARLEGRKASVCYACLFGRPEYTLPCSHVICFGCLREFDQSSKLDRYPGIVVHENCVLCSTKNQEGQETWPYTMEYRPDLSGVRLLSLDGGGVRAIIQLSILQRLEKTIGLDLRIAEFFDLMVGTSAGGLIALGLGIHNLKVDECINRFKDFCRIGFQHRHFSKNRVTRWMVRLVMPSIYKTKYLEQGMRRMFGPESRTLFGHHGNSARVAVTTTNDDRETRLLANYNPGDGRRYLKSSIATWEAARCTSAAPMYFKPFEHDGRTCLDGGLKKNNPIDVSIAEARTIWPHDVTFDLVLSVGSGHARRPPRAPETTFLTENWMVELFKTLISTLNGEDAWKDFNRNVQHPLSDKCYRLNVRFDGDTEPELDGVSQVDKMEKLANSFEFLNRPPSGLFAPIPQHLSPNNYLEVLAGTLKASLFFFEITDLRQHEDVSIIKGWICCRLHPSRKAFQQLIEETSGFIVKGQNYKMPELKPGSRFKQQVTFQQQDRELNEPIRVEAQLKGYAYTISGFPMTLLTLRNHWARSWA
ncbi:hypothetical protein DM02DRAFT_709324 [Periconia macrospinosa]|uniref:PNPLA domain-containing protein n=1 Tax=Periconia macrospinosa TaxID=97972 RepID=A0A2V1E814_9PLEO|nr:hypothetical protein DM02DRAFT_709324 [Periconia macrospinosa]